MVPGAISTTGTGVGTAVVSERVGVTPINTGVASEKEVGVSVGAGVSVGVAVGLGVKVAVGSGVGTGVKMGDSGVGTGVGVTGGGVGSGMVGASVGSTKMETGSSVISNTPSIAPEAINTKAGAIHLPRSMLTSPRVRLHCPPHIA